MQALKKIGFTSILCLLVLLFMTIPTNASTITVNPLDSEQGLGAFSLDIVGSGFTEGAGGSVGGGLDVSWDPSILTLDSVNRTFPIVGSYYVNAYVINNTAGTLTSLSVSNFTGTSSTAFDIAQLNFTAIGLGLSSIDLTVSLSDVWADYFAGSITAPLDVDGSVNVVPIPGALWLLGSGLIGMVGIRRKLGKS